MPGFGAIAETAIATLPDTVRIMFDGYVTYTAVESEGRLIYVCTENCITRLADTPPGQPLDGTLDKPPRFDRSIISADGFCGLTNAWGDAQIINSGRDYDPYSRGYAISGREAVLKAFDPTGPYDDGFVAARLIATSLTVDGQMMTIGFRDKSFRLDVPTQPNVYTGTGGLEGGAELAGKRKPLCFGRVKNISPVPLIVGELVFQANDGPIDGISAVYDRGYPLTASSDYATPALLRAATINDGAYATCLAYGLLRIASAYEQITCDARGDASGSGYVETTGTIIRRIIALTGCLVDPDEIDTVSFSNLELDQPAPVVYYLDADSTETVAETIDNLSGGIWAFCGFTRLGMLQISVFKAPGGTPAATFENGCPEILDLEIEKLPSAFDPPPWRQRVPYELNWTIIADPYSGVAESYPDLAAWLAGPYKIATTSTADGDAILEDHPHAQDPGIAKSYFALKVDAQADADRRLTLANSGYELYRVRLKTRPFTFDICQTIWLADDRYELEDGLLLRIPAISDIPDDDTVELRAFG